MTSLSLPWRSATSARPLRPLFAVLIAAGLVVAWALWAGWFNTAQFGDNVEQFNWAQSLELGYHKHPPLPSWVLGAVIKLLGPSIYWAYVLATLCLLGTMGFTWLIGRELVGERVAAAAIVLWGLNMSFSQRVQLYNHNTLLVLCMAATVWFGMKAAKQGQTRWWIATGLGAAAAMLSKYQAAVPLAGLLLAMAWGGYLKAPRQWRGLSVALSVLMLACAPHAIWVADHDFSTLRYASDAVESSGPAERFGFVVSFAANQVRLAFPALAAIAVCWAWSRWVRPAPANPAGAAADAVSPQLRVWMFGLLWAGLLVLLVMALGAGVSLRNHWGVQTLQFFCIWLAMRWDGRRRIDLRVLVVAALVVHAVNLTWYAVEHTDPRGLLSSRRIDTMYPAKRLARAAVAHWTTHTDCPLRYVAGTVFDAGLVSLYSGGKLEVFDTAPATPWVRPEDMLRRGALVVLDENDPVPTGVSHVVPFELVLGDLHGRPAKIIRLGVQMPSVPCK